MATPLLFDELPRSRSKLVRMHVVDASCESGLIVVVECWKCGHSSGWIQVDTVTEAKRGIPCPNCNRRKSDEGAV